MFKLAEPKVTFNISWLVAVAGADNPKHGEVHDQGWVSTHASVEVSDKPVVVHVTLHLYPKVKPGIVVTLNVGVSAVGFTSADMGVQTPVQFEADSH